MPFTYEYPRPAVTVDVVLFTMQANDLAVLLIRRRLEPFAGAWALPGGFVEENEKLHVAAARELSEETGVRGVPLEQLGAFGDPGRDPRGHTVSVAFLSFALTAQLRVRAGDDAAEAAWFPLKELGLVRGAPRKARQRLAFDHALVIDVARQRLQAHLDHPRKSAPYDLVPPRFTLTELQLVYEAVLGAPIDRRRFRRRMVGRGLVEPVMAKRRTADARVAKLYRWADTD